MDIFKQSRTLTLSLLELLHSLHYKFSAFTEENAQLKQGLPLATLLKTHFELVVLTQTSICAIMYCDRTVYVSSDDQY